MSNYVNSDRDARRDYEKWGFFTVILLLELALALRPLIETRAPDFAAYVAIYNGGFSDHNFGFGSVLFVSLGHFARWLGISAELFLFAISSFALLAKAYVFYRLQKQYSLCWLASAIFLFPTFFIVDYFEVRNALAQSFLTVALWARIERRLRVCCLACCFAIASHFSALLFVPFLIFPVVSLCLVAAGIAVFAMTHISPSDLVRTVRGHGSGGDINHLPPLQKLLLIGAGGYGLPITAFLASHKMREHQTVYSDFLPAIYVVIGSMVYWFGLWLVPEMTDSIFHRTHRVGWFGFMFVLLALSKRKTTLWGVAAPLSAVMTIYYFYLNILMK